MINFLYSGSAPSANDLHEQVLAWAITHQHNADAVDVTSALLRAYIAAAEFESDGEEYNLKLLTGPEAEQVSAQVYGKASGLSLEDLWNGNSGWTYPESLPYLDAAIIPRDIVVTVTRAIAESDRAVARACREAYERSQGVQS